MTSPRRYPLAHFVAYGLPVPQGALVRAGNSNRLYHRNAKDLNRYRDAIRRAAAFPAGPLPPEYPCTVELVFYLPPLKRPVRPHPTVRPDLDKLTRAALDALTETRDVMDRLIPTWLSDDAQVVDLVVRKRYAATLDEVRTVGRLWEGADEEIETGVTRNG